MHCYLARIVRRNADRSQCLDSEAKTILHSRPATAAYSEQHR
jgi:hypothetical protein